MSEASPKTDEADPSIGKAKLVRCKTCDSFVKMNGEEHISASRQDRQEVDLGIRTRFT